MARMSGTTWRPIPINFTNNGQDSVRGVVIHIMAGTLAGTDSWFRNPRAQASSHFGTGKAGALYQWVDTSDRAWAQAGGNRTWLSVENEGQGGDRLTSAQMDRCAEVLAWAHKTHGVPLQVASGPSGRGLGYHAMGGSAWGGHTSCPGSKIVAQLPEILKRAKAIAGGNSGSSGATYTVKAGDTLSGIGARLGIKWTDLAAWNGIKAPYVLKVGQKLRTKKSSTTAPVKPTVSLANVVAAAKRDPGLAQGKATHAADVKPVEAALVAEGLLAAKWARDGSFGSLTRNAYAGWQRRLGFSGKDADGFPGRSSLGKLGTKHGFRVK